MTGTPLHTSSDRQHRVAVEEAFGPHLRAWILSAGVRFVDVARMLALSTNDLAEVLDGSRHFRAAWLELLPPAVEVLYLRSRAEHHGYELRPVAPAEATLAHAIADFGAALAQCGASEADGHVSPDEAARDLAAIEALEEKLSALKQHRRRALAERGVRVLR